MTEIILYKSPTKALRLIFLSSIFVLPSAYILYNQENPNPIFWVSSCFFGFCCAIGIFSLFDKRPQLILNNKGIWDRRLKMDFIKWDDIVEAYLISIHSNYFISLVLTEQAENQAKLYAWAETLNKEVGAQKVNINIGDIKVDKNKILDAVQQLSSASQEERMNIINRLNLT